MKKLLLTIALGIFITMPMKVYAQVTVPAGGTGLSSYTAGDMIYAGTTNPIRFTKLPIGNSGFCLTSNGSIPVWNSCGGSGGSGGGTFSTTTSTVGGQLINYPNNTTDIVNIGSTSTTTAKFYFDPNTSRSLIPYASSTMITALTASTSQAIFSGGPWVDARTCGAKGDGSTDDSAAINTCISNLATAGGGTVYISATANRSALTKYEVCAAPISMKTLVNVNVQQGVALEACNGYASSTVQFLTGTHDSYWNGGQFQEAGTGQKLWNAFNLESDDISGGVFFDGISDVRINFPSKAIRLYTNNTAQGWINSILIKDIVVNDPTNAFTFEDDGATVVLGIEGVKYQNIQMQANSSTETCFQSVKHKRIQIDNAWCYDMNATSTSLSIAQGTLSTYVSGGKVTLNNFSDLGDRTVITGDSLYPFYMATSTGKVNFYISPFGQTVFGTSSANWTNSNELVGIAGGAMTLGIGNSPTNSRIQFYKAGSADTQQDYIKGAQISATSPNSGTFGGSARQDIVWNIDSDSTVSNAFFAIRNNTATIDTATTNELFRVMEGAGGGLVGIGSTTPGTTLSVVGDGYITGHVTAKDFVSTSTITSNVFPYASTTALSASSWIDSLNFLATGSTTLQAFTATNATTTNATTTTLGIGSLNGLLRANTGAVKTATNGTDYSLITALTCSAGQHLNSTAANGTFTCSADSGGGGGSGGGTWATTTSNVSGQLINYSLNNTDIVTVGNQATTSAPFYFDPNILFAKIGGQLFVTGSSTLQSFTAVSGTTTAATSTNIFATRIDGGAETLTGNMTAGNFITGTGVVFAGQYCDPSSCNTRFDPVGATNADVLVNSATIASFRANGSVGIGSTTPAATLGVAGSIYATGNVIATSTTASSVFPYASTTVISTANIFDSALTSGNCLQATTNGKIIDTGSACGSGGGGGTPDWNKQTTFNTLSLTPTTTIAVWLKDKLFASSTAQIDGDVNFASSSIISLASVASTSISHLETGGLSFDQDAGIVNAFDLPVVNASSGTVESYSFNVNGSTTPTATVYAESDGSGGAKNQRFGIGTTTPWRSLDVNGTVGFKNLTTSSSAQSAYLCLSATNEVISDSTTCLVSALKFKKNIANLDVGLDELMKLRPVSYELKDTMGDINNKGRLIGFIADEAQKVDPRLVTLDSNGDIHGFRYEQFTAVITKSIQELNAKVKTASRSAEENWQDILIGLLIVYVGYNEFNKRRK